MLFEKKGIIVACDVLSIEELNNLVKEISQINEIIAFKIGFSLALRYSLDKVVNVIRSITSKPIIYDHQKAGTDIPQMGLIFAEICAKSHVDAIIIFPHSGPETLKTWIDSCNNFKIIPIVGAVMTHPCFLESEGGFIVDNAPLKIYNIALTMGVVDFVLPATKPKHIMAFKEEARQFDLQQFMIMLPGIGRQKADIKLLKEYFIGMNWSPIIGSAIYNSADPAFQAHQLAEELDLIEKKGFI